MIHVWIRILQQHYLFFFSMFYSKFIDGKDEVKKNVAYDDYKTITTIDDESIIHENFDCDSEDKLILKGTIKRKLKEINRPCKSMFNQFLSFSILATKFTTTNLQILS